MSDVFPFDVSTRKFALVASVAITVALTFPSGGPAAPSRCAARHPTTLLQSSKVRVFKQPTRDGVRGFDVFACLKATGDSSMLGSSFSGDYPFLYPAIDLTGPVIGYAHEECDEEFCATSVMATDLRHPDDFRGSLNGSYGAPRPHRLVKVGSLRVTRSGTLVWIACPERRHTKLSGSRKPNCVRAGAADAVYMRVSRSEPLKRLDHGRSIDPSSLRLKSGRASWLHGGHRRHVAVPG
jgi:hypothetical protein